MKKEVKKMFLLAIASGVIFALIGVFLLFAPNETIKIISYILGILIGVMGMVSIITFFTRKTKTKYSSFRIAYGIICIVAAVFFLFKQEDMSKILPYVLSIIMVINSVFKIDYIMQLKKEDNKNWSVAFLSFIFSLVFSLFIIFNPFKNAEFRISEIGMILIFYSVLDIIVGYVIKCNIKEITETKDEPLTDE